MGESASWNGESFDLVGRPYGECGVLIECRDLNEVHALFRSVRGSDLVEECVPGAETLYVRPRSPAMSSAELVRRIALLPAKSDVFVDDERPLHIVEVVYDGVDLVDVAGLTGLSVEEVVRRHTAPTYTVAFLGFSRAFPYLVGLDPALVVPRLDSPRPNVPAGSIAMGAGFTGIYPASTPGGWRLLGRSRMAFFDEGRDPPGLLAPGDRLRFQAVLP